MKIIHCADLHLDSKMETNFPSILATQRNHEIIQTFERMVDYARCNYVNAILLCGDIFDSKHITQTTLDYFFDIIHKAFPIQFFYLRGNHDENNIFQTNHIPANLMLFSNQWQYYRSNNLVIAGAELTEKNASSLYNSLFLNPDRINIVMLHGQIGTECRADIIKLSRLAGKNIDYLALGHIHSYQCNRLDHRGIYCYSGCLEGRGFDETGEKGFVLLEINDHSIHNCFIPFSSRQLHKIEIDVSGSSKITDVLDSIKFSCKNIPENDLLQITLVGINHSTIPFDTDFLINMLSADYCYVKIIDKSKTSCDHTFDYHSNSLYNAFIRSVSKDTTLNETERNTIIKIGLTALKAERF